MWLGVTVEPKRLSFGRRPVQPKPRRRAYGNTDAVDSTVMKTREGVEGATVE